MENGSKTSIGMVTRRKNCEKENAMFEGLFQPSHLMIVAGIALLVFGPKKELGKAPGESISGFKARMAAKEEARVPAKVEDDRKAT